MKKLITAFKGVKNPSFQLASQLPGEKLFLTNSFAGLEKEINAVLQSYDAVYMLGVSPALRREIRIETCACCGETKVSTELDISSFLELANSYGIAYHLSDTPTQYLCNAAYYRMLGKNRNTVFVHIPSPKGMDTTFLQQLCMLFSKLLG